MEQEIKIWSLMFRSGYCSQFPIHVAARTGEAAAELITNVYKTAEVTIVRSYSFDNFEDDIWRERVDDAIYGR